LKHINGLPVPQLLLDLVSQGRWRHPGDDALRNLAPGLYSPVYDPVEFLSLDRMVRESRSDVYDRNTMETFKERAGSTDEVPDLPWIDIEKRVFIAVCAPGADVGIALDYRPSPDNPRVVALCYSGDPSGEFYWTHVSDSFDDFVCDCQL
jgi:hypothetical protein